MGYSNNLRTWRDRRDMTREKLAVLLDVSAVTIFRIERGEQQPRAPLLLKICALFNEDPTNFYASNGTQMAVEAPPYNYIGRNLHRLREEKRLSLEDLERETGIIKQTLYNIEQTGSGYDDRIIARLCAALGETPGILFDEGAARAHYPLGRPFLIKDARDFSADPPGIDGPRRYTFNDDSFGVNTFAWKMQDRSMAPVRLPQDILFIDPDAMPSPNSIVLAQREKDEPVVRRYRLIAPGQAPIFELVPMDDGYPTLHSERDTIRILGIEIEYKSKAGN